MSHSVAIVGCGAIAGGYEPDTEAPVAGSWPRTHAAAIARHDRFELLACVDPDAERRAAFGARWSVEHHFADVDDLRALAPDVVVVAAPTAAHAPILERLVELAPRAIVCEKPATASLAEANAAIEAFDRSSIQVCVNYSRAWDRALDEIATVAPLRRVTAQYTGTLVNSASHLIELVLRHVGPAEVTWRARGRGADRPSFGLRCGDVDVDVSAIEEVGYDLFRATFHGDAGELCYDDAGLDPSMRRPAPNPHFSGRTVLGPRRALEPGYPAVLERMYDEVAAGLATGSRPRSDLFTARDVHRLCQRIMEIDS